ncbi:MAG: putative N-acyltransferase, partial [Gammaproteobacteria bacterium]
MSDCPEKQPESYRIEVHNSMQIIDKQQWNGLLHDDDPPFIRHEFLDLLEESESATSETGWSPCHLTLHSDQGDLDAASIIGAAPAYFKQHSYGEYVFDWAWARAYQQHGLDYYPKLLCAIPFTPVTTRKFLGHKDQTPNIESLLTQGLRQIAEQEKLSSIHILFCPQKEIEAIS